MKTRKSKLLLCIAVVALALYCVFAVSVFATEADSAKDVSNEYVAEINGTKYESLEAAIEAAEEGDTITLLVDLTIESDLKEAAKGIFNIAADDKITLDLNGKKIEVTDNSDGNFTVFYNYGEFTIKNGTVEVTSNKDRGWNAQSAVILNRGGILTVESGTYEHKGGTTMAFAVDNSGNSFGDAYLYLKGGSLSSNYIAIRLRMADTTLNGDPGNGISVMEMTGGDVYGKNSGIWGQITNSYSGELGSLSISGGTVKGDKYAICIDDDGYENVYVEISDNASVIGDVYGDAEDFAISGGTFTVDISEYLASGCITAKNSDGMYGVMDVFEDAKYNLTTTTGFIGNFYVKVPDEDAGYTVAYDGIEYYEINGEKYYRFSTGTSVSDITAEITFKVIITVDGEQKMLIASYTIDGYFVAVMESVSKALENEEITDEDRNARILDAKLIMNAARYANELYKYTHNGNSYDNYTAILENEAYSDYLTVLNGDYLETVIEGAANNLSAQGQEVVSGMGLTVNDGYSVAFYIKASEDAQFSVFYKSITNANNKNHFEYNAVADLYFGSDMSIYDVRQTQVITAQDGAVLGEYNLADYVNTCYEKDNTEVLNLVLALYAYSEASEAYVKN